MIEKRPRQYATEICKLRSREARLAALDDVPPELVAMVRCHVESHFALRAFRRPPRNQPGPPGSWDEPSEAEQWGFDL